MKMGFFRNILNPWRLFKAFLILFLVFLILTGAYFFTGSVPRESEVVFGVTFSQVFAQEMGLDWKEAYTAALDDLGVRKLRLIAYWQKIEPEREKYFWEDLDWQIREADKRGAEIVLALGRKLPRWPECHVPGWAKNLPEPEQQARILLLIEETVSRYRNERAIKAWQVENEPFLKRFGECPEVNKDFLNEEISLVRQLDFKNRPIMLTASGELSSWTAPAVRADILGTTLYRTVWDDLLGHFRYPIPPVFYHKRAKLTKLITGIDKVVIIELQAEPWGPKMIYETSIRDQEKSMNLESFREIVEYTKKTGLDEAYLWGVEWWYQRKEQGNDALWAEAKNLFH